MLTDIELETIWALAENAVKEPRYTDVVHNDECLFTYTSPLSPDGLLVNLRTWKGISPAFIREDLEANAGSGVYLWMRHRAVVIAPQSQPTVQKLGINVPGGFQTSNIEIEKNHSVVVYHRNVFDNREFKLDDPDLPEPISTVARLVADHRGAFDQQQLVAWENTEERPVSRFAQTLTQEPASEERKKLLSDKNMWRCEISGETSNLWLNLSDGFIGGGRKNFDGSGGSNGAIDHFLDMKNNYNKMYPLAVKLGTITAQGTADVYSYEEDCMVTNPLLEQHLLHWGIDIHQLAKTEKTTAELELELNKDFAFDKIVEAGEHLEPITNVPGMKNLGNTCYLNSVVRLLLAVPELRDRYLDTSQVVRKMLGRDLLLPGEHHPVTRTIFELSKCVTGSQTESSPLSMASLREQVTFKHPEFGSNRQQDAVEFLLHFMKELTKAERASMTKNLTESLFTLELEDRLSCDNQVRYSRRSELVLPVQVVREDLSNSPKRARTGGVEFLNCLQRALGSTKLEGFRSPVTGEVSDNTFKSTGIVAMPPCLLVSVNRYYFTDSYQAAKLDCEVEMPEELDLEPFRGKGLQPGEEKLPESAVVSTHEPVNEEIVNQLAMMGFPENIVRQACVATKNSGPEQALQWCLENPTGLSKPEDPESVLMLTSLGFTETQATIALKATQGDAERAADWLLSRAGELDSLAQEKEKTETQDGIGKYDLVAIVSHLGNSTAVGHYVAHVKVDGQWLIFNDELVAKSHKPPINYGYLYLYKRKE